MTEREQLIQAIRALTVEHRGKLRLACADAFEVAERFKVPASRIGRICNRLDIRICKCQLGCFR
jgi:LAO/AO transport system kinase